MINADDNMAASVNFFTELFNFMPPKTIKLHLVYHFFKNLSVIIKDIDPNAFVSQSAVIGVYGEGFDRIKVK